VCKEFVAKYSGVPGDRSLSLGWKPAAMRGWAVPPWALTRHWRAIGAERTGPDALCSSDENLSPGTPRASALSVHLLRWQRFSRLCVLMNPILPGARSIRTWPAIAYSQYHSSKTTNAKLMFPSPEEPGDEAQSLEEVHIRSTRQQKGRKTGKNVVNACN